MLKEKLDVLDTAFEYCQKGWFVLPVKSRAKDPITSLAHQGYKSATNSSDKVSYWWSQYQDMNIGIACEQSGLIVIDIDYRNLEEFERAKVYMSVETMQVRTGDGVHLYFTTEPLSGVRGKICDGMDIKYKGYVVTAPSVHPNGRQYEANGLEPVALPNWIKERVSK